MYFGEKFDSLGKAITVWLEIVSWILEGYFCYLRLQVFVLEGIFVAAVLRLVSSHNIFLSSFLFLSLFCFGYLLSLVSWLPLITDKVLFLSN